MHHIRGEEDVYGTPMTLQHAYAQMIGQEDLTLERYQVSRPRFISVHVPEAPRLHHYSRARAERVLPHSSALPRRSRVKTKTEFTFSYYRTLTRAIPSTFQLELAQWEKLVETFEDGRYHAPLLFILTKEAPSPYEVFFNLYKPATPFRKTAPPPPDYSVIVVNGRTTPMPTLQELSQLFEELPELPPPVARKRFIQNKEAPKMEQKNLKIESVSSSSLPSNTLSARLRQMFRALFRLMRRDTTDDGTKSAPPRRPNPFQILKMGKKMIVVAAVDAGSISFFRFCQAEINKNVVLAFSPDERLSYQHAISLPPPAVVSCNTAYHAVRDNQAQRREQDPGHRVRHGVDDEGQGAFKFGALALVQITTITAEHAAYANEKFVGDALREEGLQRDEVFVTTKYVRGTVNEALQASLSNVLGISRFPLGLKQVDLYLMHSPISVEGSIENTWRIFEKAKDADLAKSIGVSNFNLEQLQDLGKIARIQPSVNQIRFHPYNWTDNKDLVEYSTKKGIVTEAYSSLTPITQTPGGPVDPVLKSIGDRIGATPAQVIFAWVKSKGVAIVTTTTKKERLEEYLAVADLPSLTDEDIAAIEKAGAKGPPTFLTSRKVGLRALTLAVGAAFFYGLDETEEYFCTSRMHLAGDQDDFASTQQVS
ncbi:hypothetical protein EW145_g6328 [Phellinidium pouzarii]|uniref:NADP-dependent oxidoreductase domain-containing protein n=1 Tax=Phellinidium pouzarii TaxID=167371 RepID=A0A4S4L1M9_9AGAM|nr:hypothetical protein EW145_g6328 [Phellinidium pouzarii]